MATDLLLLGAGFLLLWFGAGWLVRGSGSLARTLGVAPIVIGLTVVAFGTSAPELVVSAVSAYEGKPMIAAGNAIGSNICNLALVLGLCALFVPIHASRNVVRREFPLMLVGTFLLLVLLMDDGLSRTDGMILIAGLLLYTALQYGFAIHASNRTRRMEAEIEGLGRVGSPAAQLALIVLGIAGVVVGAEFVVDAAERMMVALGVSEKFIGLTLVAFGTSLPELATSVVAAARRETDLGIGNLVGSNVFNALGVMGTAGLVRPFTISGGLVRSGMAIDFGVMLLTSALPLLLLLGPGRRVGRRGGLVLLAVYSAYLAWLVATRMA